jgi:hypothetical protein
MNGLKFHGFFSAKRGKNDKEAAECWEIFVENFSLHLLNIRMMNRQVETTKISNNLGRLETRENEAAARLNFKLISFLGNIRRLAKCHSSNS